MYYKTKVLEKCFTCQLSGHFIDGSIFASSKTEFHHKQKTEFKSGAKKICQILYPKMSGFPTRQI
jgi:hypothetical protein